MRGLLIEGPGELSYREDLPRPEARAGDVRVRVLKAGVCATDLALLAGYMDFRGIPGHEFVGVAQDGPHAGRRVVGEINAACGTCATCRAGRPRHCPRRTVLGILRHSGAFAEELVLPAENLLPVPDAVSDRAATFCEPLAAAYEIASQVDLGDFHKALVCGDGRLGLLCAMVLASAGLEVHLAGRHPERARLVPGARFALGLLEEDGERRPEFDLVVEATGSPDVFERALACVRPRGCLVLKTTSARTAPVDLAPVVVNEIQVLGSRCGAFAPALQALASGTFPVEELIEHELPLIEGERAVELAGRPGTLKVLIEMSP